MEKQLELWVKLILKQLKTGALAHSFTIDPGRFKRRRDPRICGRHERDARHLIAEAFGYDTLAVRVWQLTSESLWEAAALPALTIVAAGIIPVMILVRGHVRPNSARANPPH